MKLVAQLLNEMRDAAVITNYALFGAIAQMRYTEAVATIDADVLVAVPSPDRIDILSPIYQFCSDRGYRAEGEAIRVGNWPVQFVPVFDAVTRQALVDAESGDFEGVPIRIVRADYLAVIALGVGRPKDFARILALLESGSVKVDQIASLADRFELSDQWHRFVLRFLNE